MESIISIIVPVYNVEKYLTKCLDSLLSQTLEDIEIICVNDGSSDHSLEILQEYASRDNRIRVFDQPNGGVSVARNNALKHVNGERLARPHMNMLNNTSLIALCFPIQRNLVAIVL